MHKCQTTQWKIFFNIKSHVLISLWFCTSFLVLLLNWVKALGLFCFEKEEDKIGWLLFWHFIITFFSWFEISAHLISFSLCFSVAFPVCVHALLVCNASGELASLRNMEEHFNPSTLPLIPYLLKMWVTVLWHCEQVIKQQQSSAGISEPGGTK